MGCSASIPLPPKDEKKKRRKQRRPKLNPDDLNPSTAGPPPEDPAITDICRILAEATALEHSGQFERAILMARTAAVHFTLLSDNDGGFYAMLTLSHIGQCNFALRKWRLAIADFLRVMHLSGIIAKEKLRGSYLTLHHLCEAAIGCAKCHVALADGEKDESPLPPQEEDSDDDVGNAMPPLPGMAPPPPAAASGPATTDAPPPPPPLPPLEEQIVGPNGETLDDPATLMFTSLKDSAALSILQLTPDQHMKEAEIALLRGIGLIEEYHSRRSDLLVQPLALLSEIYVKRNLSGLAELTMRKQLGVLLILYGPHDPQYKQAQVKLADLVEERERTAQVKAATTIAKTWRMRRAMGQLAKRFGRASTTRHTTSEYTGVVKPKEATAVLMHALAAKDRPITETMRPADAPVEDNHTRLQNMCFETRDTIFGVQRPPSIGKRRKMANEPVRAYAATPQQAVGPFNESDGGGIAAIFRHSVMATNDFAPFVVGMPSLQWNVQPANCANLITTKLALHDNAAGPRGTWCIIARAEELESPAAKM
jgi:hypothetical protein